MKLKYLSDTAIAAFIETALNEDVGDGDHTTLASVPAGVKNKARLIIKGDGIIAGLELAEKIFKKVDNGLNILFLKKDGDYVRSGDIGLMVEGEARSILTSERLVLNCLQRMSGIATYTHSLNKLIEGTGAKLLDTRKTSPNSRIIEKWAVAIGGGKNHRYGLFDMILLKDNHIDFAGGIKKAILSTQQYLKEKRKDLRIEIETRTLEEVREVLETGGVDVILLDNMKPEMLKEAVKIVNGKCETEASGGIDEQNIRSIAESGVNYISVGALTHSYKSMDMSLKAYSEK